MLKNMKYFGEKNYEHGSKDKTGVLITNLGTPDAPDEKTDSESSVST